MSEFECKVCHVVRPLGQEVVTRYRTGTCRQCWGQRVHSGHVQSKGVTQLVTGQALGQIIAEVQYDHIKRLDVPVDDLKPRPFKHRPRPKTALISEACMNKYYERIASESVRKKSA